MKHVLLFDGRMGVYLGWEVTPVTKITLYKVQIGDRVHKVVPNLISAFIPENKLHMFKAHAK